MTYSARDPWSPLPRPLRSFFFFNDTATTEIYTLSLHDALPISPCAIASTRRCSTTSSPDARTRSEEHTSELQSRFELVCRLLLEKKKNEAGSDTAANIQLISDLSILYFTIL